MTNNFIKSYFNENHKFCTSCMSWLNQDYSSWKRNRDCTKSVSPYILKFSGTVSLLKAGAGCVTIL